MPENLKPLDITNAPELLHLAEEVRKSNISHVLKRGSEELVKVVPIKATPRPRATRGKTRADYEAFRSAAGGWKDVDTDKLIADIYRDRRSSNRPPVEL